MAKRKRCNRKAVHPVYAQICDGCGRDWFASKNCWECPWCGLLAKKPNWGGKISSVEHGGGHGHKTYAEAKIFQEQGKGQYRPPERLSEREILERWEENGGIPWDRFIT